MKEGSDVLSGHVGYWLRLISNEVSLSFARALEVEGVSVAEWVVLAELKRLGEAAPSEIAECIQMTRGAVSKIFDRLEGKGLVLSRPHSTDGRGQVLSLSEGGLAILPRLVALADANDERYFGHLELGEREALIALMRDCGLRHGLQMKPTS